MSETIALRVPGSRKRLRVRTASSWRYRAADLLGLRDAREGAGLWVKPCRVVHTFGLRGAVDVVYLRADGVVAKVVQGLKPWRLSRCREACTALELRAGLASRLNIAPGMALDLLA